MSGIKLTLFELPPVTTAEAGQPENMPESMKKLLDSGVLAGQFRYCLRRPTAGAAMLQDAAQDQERKNQDGCRRWLGY